MKLLEELQRRKVFRVGIAYLALAWLLVQIAETLLPAYGFSDAALRGLVAALAIGLVIALVLAWIFDWTPEGVRLTAPADAAPVDGAAPSQRAPNAVIAVIILVAAALAAWLTFRTVDVTPPSERRIAVLPFATLGQEQADVFTDGIHVGVISRLSNVADLEVISRTSVLALRNRDRPLPQIAGELGAAWVLNADVQQAGEQVMVSVRLADARADRQVWAEDYRRSLSAENLFEIQADITGRIIDEVNARLTDPERVRVARVPTESLEAYGLYQQGRALLQQRTPDAMRSALAYFERALDRDPGYALAWTGLADALSVPVAYELERDPGLIERAEQAVARALELDPELAEAWASRGMLEYLQRDVPAAIAALDRAIEYRPSYSNAHTLRCFLYALIGDEETAWASASWAVRVDPLSAEALSNLAASSAALGRHQQALEAARRGLELAPGWPNTRLAMGIVLFGAGDFAGAAEQLAGVTMPWTGAGAETLRFLSLLELGREREARELLPAIETSGDAYAMAVVTAALGDLPEAYAQLLSIERWDDFPAQMYQSFHKDFWNPGGGDPRYAQVRQRILASWGVAAEYRPVSADEPGRAD
jgi:TolB-like protein/Tfp pilus assembly protein PilF